MQFEPEIILERRYMRKKRYLVLKLCLAVTLIGFILPEPRTIPVKGATSSDWHANTFWFEPWGRSGVHKGVDIFASEGTKVVASTPQWVVYRGEFSRGGNVIIALGPKWRFHYYAHLESIDADTGTFVASGESLGSVGTTGNARGKPAHLHYSILSLWPHFWLMDNSHQGYKKAFYLDPTVYF